MGWLATGRQGGLVGDRYRLIERLGTGGMSVVWRAHDQVLGRAVAVKVLSPQLAGDDTFRDRLRQEALAAARLNHPHITGIFDFGESPLDEHRTVPYVVMELNDGESVADRLVRQGPLPWRDAVVIVTEVASALATAHARGVVHRDVTPANVMLTGAGAKVVDFGISALVGQRDAAPDGSLLGTPAYLAPERLGGGQVAPAADVYALGLLLYRALTGRLPWPAGNTTQALRAHLFADPAPVPALPGMPAQVADLCLRCLAKQPEDRPGAATVAEVLGALVGIQPIIPPVVAGDRTPGPRPSPHPAPRPVRAPGLRVRAGLRVAKALRLGGAQPLGGGLFRAGGLLHDLLPGGGSLPGGGLLAGGGLLPGGQHLSGSGLIPGGQLLSGSQHLPRGGPLAGGGLLPRGRLLSGGGLLPHGRLLSGGWLLSDGRLGDAVLAGRHRIQVGLATVILVASVGLAWSSTREPADVGTAQAAAAGAGPGAVVPHGAGCKVRYRVQRDSGSDFGAQVTVINTGERALSAWSLEFAFTGGQRLTDAPKRLTQRGRKLVLRAKTDTALRPGRSATVTLSGSYRVSNPLPVAFTLNGYTCRAEVIGAVGAAATEAPVPGGTPAADVRKKPAPRKTSPAPVPSPSPAPSGPPANNKSGFSVTV